MKKLKLTPITDSVNSANWEILTQWWAVTVAMSFGIPPRYFSKIVPNSDLGWIVAERMNLTVGLLRWYRPAIVLILIILMLVIVRLK